MTEKKKEIFNRKVKGAFFFLFCEVIDTRGRIKVVTVNISEQFVLFIHAAHDFHRQQRVFLRFLEKKATVPKPSTTTMTSTFSCLETFDKMTTN